MRNFSVLLIKLVILTIIYALFLSILGGFFISKKSGNKTWDSFYNQPSNSIDLLFLGNSHIGNGIDLNIVTVKTKANVNTIYSSGQILNQIYYSFKETLKYQSPKLIVIETFAIPGDSIYYFKDPVKESDVPFKAKIQSFDSKKIGLVKLNEYLDIYKDEEFLPTFFPLIRNHSNWNKEDFVTNNLFEEYNPVNSTRFYKGSSNSITTLSKKRVEGYKKKTFKNEPFKIAENQLEYFNKIMELAKKHNIEVMLLTIPYFKEYRNKIDYSSFHTEINNLALKNNIKHLDLNVVFPDWDNTNFSNEYVGYNQHVNYKGAIKTSNYLSNFINTNYNLNSNVIPKSLPEFYLYNDIKRDTLKEGNRLLGNLEKINGTKNKQYKIRQGSSPLVLDGWTAIENIDSKNSEIFIGLKSDNNSIYVSKASQFKPIERKDVSKFFKKENIYDNSGFKINVNSLLLEKGKYKVFMIIRNSEGEVLVKNSNKRIEII
ncbi:hypothetical protein KO494_00755 [Lacinutrix sp. C3R15]|uniref:hypothetical protein n=1 Tax=Flavobacteriaceae TaxID=49546 RepID=UPI001C08880C|nr:MULTISPECIES: hypothetical protein [Flavobacteriaceae]MBU2938055.1 hypothetical protein [Lacinutrix sp. C3R15]MDO6621369.1 hypothetical protein [Oceanihabitans sp. 1_MG-2023]